MNTSAHTVAAVTALFLLPATPGRQQPETPVTFVVQSTVPARPVRFSIVCSGLANVVADSIRAVADTIVTSTPARLTVGDGVVHVIVHVAPGEPPLFVSSDGLEVWGDRVEFRRHAIKTNLQVLAPAMRWRSR